MGNIGLTIVILALSKGTSGFMSNTNSQTLLTSYLLISDQASFQEPELLLCWGSLYECPGNTCGPEEVVENPWERPEAQ